MGGKHEPRGAKSEGGDDEAVEEPSVSPSSEAGEGKADGAKEPGGEGGIREKMADFAVAAGG